MLLTGKRVQSMGQKRYMINQVGLLLQKEGNGFQTLHYDQTLEEPKISWAALKILANTCLKKAGCAWGGIKRVTNH